MKVKEFRGLRARDLVRFKEDYGSPVRAPRGALARLVFFDTENGCWFLNLSNKGNVPGGGYDRPGAKLTGVYPFRIEKVEPVAPL